MAAGEVLKLGFHCLGLLKQRWTPSQFYTRHCLLSPQRSLSRDLEPGFGRNIFSASWANESQPSHWPAGLGET